LNSNVRWTAFSLNSDAWSSSSLRLFLIELNHIPFLLAGVPLLVSRFGLSCRAAAAAETGELDYAPPH
jgi:hypothetical protein